MVGRVVSGLGLGLDLGWGWVYFLSLTNVGTTIAYHYLLPLSTALYSCVQPVRGLTPCTPPTHPPHPTPGITDFGVANDNADSSAAQGAEGGITPEAAAAAAAAVVARKRNMVRVTRPAELQVPIRILLRVIFTPLF